MAIGSIASLASSYVQSLFTGNASNSNTAATAATISAPNTNQDTNQLSPFAQLLSTLEKVAQNGARRGPVSNP